MTLFSTRVCAVTSVCFYVLHSVMNLFLVSLFWAYMADHFTLEDSKRIFSPLALGGSLGAILGSLISSLLVQRTGPYLLLPLAAILLELAGLDFCVFLIGHGPPYTPKARSHFFSAALPLRASNQFFHSRYLAGIGVFYRTSRCFYDLFVFHRFSHGCSHSGLNRGKGRLVCKHQFDDATGHSGGCSSLHPARLFAYLASEKPWLCFQSPH